MAYILIRSSARNRVLPIDLQSYQGRKESIGNHRPCEQHGSKKDECQTCNVYDDGDISRPIESMIKPGKNIHKKYLETDNRSQYFVPFFDVYFFSSPFFD